MSSIDTVVTFTGEMDEYLFEDETSNEAPSASDPVSLEDAIDETIELIEDAVDFMESDMEPEWAKAEEYFDGDCEVPKVHGRSQVSSTDVRDAIRALKPSIMRVFTQSDAIVEYSAPKVALGTLAVQQTKYVNQRFWKSGGYNVLNDLVHSALTKKVGIGKAWCFKESCPEYMNVSNLTKPELMYLAQMEGVYVLEIEEVPSGGLDGAPRYDAKIARLKQKKTIDMSHVPMHGFFISDDATCTTDARVIGQRENLPVSDIEAMGLTYDDWSQLDGLDLEQSDGFSDESRARRGYDEEDGEENIRSLDPTMRRVLLTEAYVRFDLDGIGIAQLYRFWFGGTSYEYLAHERVSEIPYSNWQIDPIPGAFFGRSIYDILKEDQDTATSLLRATCDNAHLSNNKRLAIHETLVNMDDVVNTKLGYPIRFRQPGMIQEIGVSSSVGAMLPLLQHLKQMGENKVGVTNAAMGLDPDALQSTDKDAVRNTIELAQGQVELMVRNLAETGGRTMFTQLLNLSIRHFDPEQVIQINDTVVPVDIRMFQSDFPMTVNVGLGTASYDMKLAGLNQILAQQKEVLAQYGPNNGIVTLQQVFNTVFDIAAMLGITNINRYFNAVNPQMEQNIAAQAAQRQDQMDPATALVKAEEIKARTSAQNKHVDAQLDAAKMQQEFRGRLIELLLKDDLERDEMAQELEIAHAKLVGDGINRIALAREQNKPRILQAQNAAKAARGTPAPQRPMTSAGQRFTGGAI